MKINQHYFGNTSIDILPCTKDDIDDMMLIFEESIRNTCKYQYSPVQIDTWIGKGKNKVRWLEKFSEQQFIKAVIKDLMVGFASLEANDYFDFLYVHSTFQKKGVARLMADHIETIAFTKGTQLLRVHASETAKPFFLKRGYTLLVKNEFLMGDISIHNYEMTKKL